jgi:hypothetical protein
MQYRGRVKGKVTDNAYVVARLYYEQELVVQEENSRRLDVAVVGIGGELEAGLIAVGRGDLRRVPMATGVAGGPGKVSGILGAARAGLVNALVTDEETAASCLRLSEAA